MPDLTLSISDLRGGLNTRQPGNSIADNEVQDILNWEFTADGKLRTRQGTEKYNAVAIGSGGPITSIQLNKFSDGTRKLTATEGTGIYVDDGTGVFSPIKTGLTSGQYFSHCMFADQGIYANGADAIQTYDGTTCSDLANAPSGARIVSTHREYLWAMGPTADRHLIQCSVLRDPTTWTGADITWTGYIEYQDAYPPLGMISFMDSYLYVFSRQWVGRIVGDTPDSNLSSVFTPEVVAKLTGSPSPFSIVPIGSDVFFFDTEGVKSLADTERAAGIEYPSMTFKVQDKINSLNTNKYNQFYAANHKNKNQYWLLAAESGQTYTNTVIVLDYALRTEGPMGVYLPAVTIFKFTEPRYPTCIALLENTAGQDILYCGSSDGYIYQMDTGDNDNGYGYTKRIKTKAYNFGDFEVYKDFVTLYAEMKMGTSGSYAYNISWDLNLNSKSGGAYSWTLSSSSAKWDAVKWNQFKWGPVLNNRKNILLKRYGQTLGRDITFRLSNAGADEAGELNHLTLMAEPRGYWLE